MKKKYEVKEIKDAQELQDTLQSLYVIGSYTKTEDIYNDFQEEIYTIMKGCIEKKDCREFVVKFKFYPTDTEIHSLQFRHFLINVFLWYPFVHMDGIKFMDKNIIMDCFNDIPHINDYINNNIIYILRKNHIRSKTINKSISTTLYNLRRISIDFSQIMNLTLGSEVFINTFKENKRMQEIMQTKFPNDMQPNEIEDELNKLMKEEIEIFKSMKNNPVGIILRTGTGLKHKQLSEFTINRGLKPDLSDVTIPIAAQSSTLINGLDRPSALYIDALGARKSLVMNKVVMGNAGYFGKIVLELSRTLSLSKSVSDCGARHLVTINISSKKMLEKYNGRYYKLDNNPEAETYLLDSDTDTNLIGKTLYFRSPITCTCGDEVCHKCFGTISLLNLDISEGVAGFETEEVTKVVNQMILSTNVLCHIIVI